MNKVTLVEAFRDFFYYGTSVELCKAYTAIKLITGTNLSHENIDWEQEEFLFNKLFVGPAAPLAPAVASVYIDPEEKIQGRITAQVREFYQSVGLGMQEPGAKPEDSIEFELDALRYLLLLQEQVPEAELAYKDFINEHIALWIGDFTERALLHCGESSAVGDVLQLLVEFIDKEAEKTLVSKEIS